MASRAQDRPVCGRKSNLRLREDAPGSAIQGTVFRPSVRARSVHRTLSPESTLNSAIEQNEIFCLRQGQCSAPKGVKLPCIFTESGRVVDNAAMKRAGIGMGELLS